MLASSYMVLSTLMLGAELVDRGESGWSKAKGRCAKRIVHPDSPAAKRLSTSDRFPTGKGYRYIYR